MGRSSVSHRHELESVQLPGALVRNQRFSCRTSCARCGDILIAPEWSGYVANGHAVHRWNCANCDYQFETRVTFRREFHGLSSSSLPIRAEDVSP
jgi:hypothetical protein